MTEPKLSLVFGGGAAKAAPPTGTVTFLFSDIEGSTRLLRALGAERYGNALEQHRRLLREAFAAQGGYEVDTQGDSFFIAFGRAADAVKAAVDAQHALAGHAWAEGERIRVRMAVHTCEATLAGSRYVGMGVHRAARICAAGHGEQVLVSHTTRDLLEDDSGIVTIDLGTHGLKDFEQPHRLYQVADAQLPRSFPPLRTVGTRPGAAGVQPAALFGREAELASIRALAAREDVRLITLTGPGGAGKTTLASRVAAELADDFADGACVVLLAAIRDAELLLPTIAQALGVRQAAGQSLEAYLAPKELLLLLDNFEQIVAGTRTLATLLEQAPGIKLIVTSREPLHLSGEHVFPVPPLALPDPRRVLDLEQLARCDSVRLFVERARRVQPAFGLTAQNAAAIAELCVRLDGLPLALELAAARVPLLSPEAMLGRLGDRLKLLTGGARDAPERQKTLRNNLAWSHELLEEGERRLFARLAVFAGGFSLEAAEAVCEAEIDTLGALLDRSVLRREGERFGMLETIREFAREQLQASGEAGAVAARHADYFAALAERHHERRWQHAKEGLDELDREHDNLRAALDHLLTKEPRRALRLAGALGWFWHQRSHFGEGRARLAAALAATSEPDEDRARALAAAGELAAWSGDLANARPLIEAAVAIWRASGRTQEIAGALIELGWGCFYCGDEAALGLMQEGLALRQALGDPILVNRARIGFLQVLVSTGDVERVEPLAREALAVAERTRDLSSEHFAHHFLADCALMRGDCVTALRRYHRALELAVELADRSEISAELQGTAMAAAGLGHSAVALRIAGAAAAEFDALAIDLTGMVFWQVLLDRYLGQARAALGAEAAAAAWEEGRRTWFEHSIALALDLEKDAPS